MTKKIKNMKKLYSGQATLILVLGIMVLGLGIGIARFTQTNISTRESTYDNQREDAYTCAESGVEIAIKCINDLLEAGTPEGKVLESCKAGITPITDEVGACSYSYTLTELNTDFTIPKLSKDQTEVILLDGNNTPRVTITWKNPLDTGGNYLESNLLSPNSLANGYDLTQKLYSCGNVFSTTVTGAQSVNANPDCTVDIDTSGNSDFIQITARDDDMNNIRVQVAGGPTQGFGIMSVGESGQAKRTIEVNYMLPNIARSFNSSFYANSVSNN